jgi:hypothetical protein
VKILFRSEGKSAKVKEKVHWEFSNVTDKKIKEEKKISSK